MKLVLGQRADNGRVGQRVDLDELVDKLDAAHVVELLVDDHQVNGPALELGQAGGAGGGGHQVHPLFAPQPVDEQGKTGKILGNKGNNQDFRSPL